MTIQILGSGCAKCKALEANARKAVANIQLDAVVEKITDMDTIMSMGVMITPALAIDGDVKSSGKLLKPEQIEKILKEV
ncbi:MAG: TM0996/MTH895 family glutaredoxin-like protein [Spirochaetales bacterium]|nr:TM0996/MTH895 family glutaredoxin-like protein [Spirochaetales bacterium]